MPIKEGGIDLSEDIESELIDSITDSERESLIDFDDHLLDSSRIWLSQ